MREFDLADVRLGEIVFVGPTAGPLNIDTIPKTTHPRKIGTSDRRCPLRIALTRHDLAKTLTAAGSRGGSELVALVRI